MKYRTFRSKSRTLCAQNLGQISNIIRSNFGKIVKIWGKHLNNYKIFAEIPFEIWSNLRNFDKQKIFNAKTEGGGGIQFFSQNAPIVSNIFWLFLDDNQVWVWSQTTPHPPKSIFVFSKRTIISSNFLKFLVGNQVWFCSQKVSQARKSVIFLAIIECDFDPKWCHKCSSSRTYPTTTSPHPTLSPKSFFLL